MMHLLNFFQFIGKFQSKPPDCWLCDGLVIYNELDNRGYASMGYKVSAPDLENVDNSVKNNVRSALLRLLGSFDAKMRIQFHWYVDSNYATELKKYDQFTENCVKERWTYLNRKERFSRYYTRMKKRELRREYLQIFITRKIDTASPSGLSGTNLTEHCRGVIASLKSDFNSKLELVKNILSGAFASIKPMEPDEIFNQFYRKFNPSTLKRFNFDPYKDFFDEKETICTNCFNSGIKGNPKRSSMSDFGFTMDGYYHDIIVLKRCPHTVYPGIIKYLTSTSFLDYDITVNCYPCSVEKEIKKLETQLERLTGQYQDTKKHKILTSIEEIRAKIRDYSEGYTRPVKYELIIHIWSESREKLMTIAGSLKSGINQMNEAQYYEIANSVTAKNLFLKTLPGNLFTNYEGYAIYEKNSFVCDLLPFSSTFTGYLDGADAIYDGASGNLVGVKLFIGGQPQHTAMFGKTGSGKSVNTCDILTQTEGLFGYTCIIEEGLSYGLLTQLMGEKPIIIYPDSDLTINYFDTGGLPLNFTQISMACALVAKMCGHLADEDRQNIRNAQIGKYIDRVYTNKMEQHLRDNPEKEYEIARRTTAVYKYFRTRMPAGSSFPEAWVEFRDLLDAEDEETHEFLENIPESEITELMKSPNTEKLIRDVGFAYLKPHEFPTHSSLIELIECDPEPNHNEEEIKHLSTLLEPWCSYGSHGKIFDGTTNINITGKWAHFELGNIPDGNMMRKQMVGFLINNYTRNHVMKLPRSVKKRYIFEEAGRILDVPGGEAIIAEGYSQMRKFNTWIISIVQQFQKFQKSNIAPVIMGNSRCFLLQKQDYKSELDTISSEISMNDVTRQQIMDFPDVDKLPEGKRYSPFIYHHRPECGTVWNVCCPEMLYVAGTDGEVFEQRQRQLKSEVDLFAAVSKYATSEPGRISNEI